MSNNLLDLTVGLEVCKCFPCERAVNLQTIDERGNGDEAVGLNILLEFVVGLLVQDDGVVGLVLDYVVVSGDSRSEGFGMAQEQWMAYDTLESIVK